MFELINEDLEDCIDILRELSESQNEQVLSEHKISMNDIKKTVELCELLCYYYDKLHTP